jgi:hypothetical protein
LSTPTFVPTLLRPTLTPTFLPTMTPTPSSYKLLGPIDEDQIPLEFQCTLPKFNDEFKDSNGNLIPLDQYYRCQIGANLMKGILTDKNGWWWQDGNQHGTTWRKIETNEDVWKIALTVGLDAEGTTLRVNDPDYHDYLSLAFHNKFWYLDHDMLPTYNNIIDYGATSLGYNGRLVFLGSLEAIEKRVTNMVSNEKSASDVIKAPFDGYITNNWKTAQQAVEAKIWPEPSWKCPPKNEPYDFANPYDKTPQGLLDALWQHRQGTGKDEIIYANTIGKDISKWVYVLTLEPKEFFYGHAICLR